MKAFLVDDDPITLTLVAFMLNEEGIETRYSLSPVPDNFYRELEDFCPDVIVLDIYLKGEDGFNLAKNIRKHTCLKEVPIVAISGSTLIRDKIEAFSSGFIEYLPKPFTKNEIVNAVKRYGYSSEIVKLCNKINNRELLNHELYHKFIQEP
jgi:DNA-binding response OmpR family regulator